MLTSPAPTRNRAANTARPFTHAAAASAAREGIAADDEAEVVEDAELDEDEL